MTTSLPDFIVALARASSIEKSTTLLDSFLNQLGIKSYAFTYYSQYPTSRRKLRYEYASCALKAWHEHYIASQYEDTDQTLQANKIGNIPVFWDVHKQLAQAKTIREKRIREESIEFGIEKGLCIPVHGPQDDFAVLVLHQRKDEKCLHDALNNMGVFMAVGHYYYASIKRFLDVNEMPEKALYQLTRREQHCLNLTAKELLAKDIAKMLNLTERTVHFHLQNVNKKLGVKNKYQAVLKARECGLLQNGA